MSLFDLLRNVTDGPTSGKLYSSLFLTCNRQIWFALNYSFITVASDYCSFSEQTAEMEIPSALVINDHLYKLVTEPMIRHCLTMQASWYMPGTVVSVHGSA